MKLDPGILCTDGRPNDQGLQKFMEQATLALQVCLNAQDPDLLGLSIRLGCLEQLLVGKGPVATTDLQVPLYLVHPLTPLLLIWDGKVPWLGCLTRFAGRLCPSCTTAEGAHCIDPPKTAGLTTCMRFDHPTQNCQLLSS